MEIYKIELVLDRKNLKAEQLAKDMRDLFGDRFYIEIQRHSNDDGVYMRKEVLTEPEFLRYL